MLIPPTFGSVARTLGALAPDLEARAHKRFHAAGGDGQRWRMRDEDARPADDPPSEKVVRVRSRGLAWWIPLPQTRWGEPLARLLPGIAPVGRMT